MLQDYPSKLLYIHTGYTHTELLHVLTVCDMQDYPSKLLYIHTGDKKSLKQF